MARHTSARRRTPRMPEKCNAICTGTATNDPLSTWVTGVAADGVTYTLHDAPLQSAAKKAIVFDDAPGILRALNSTALFHTEHGTADSYIGGAIFIPPARNAYVINSFLPSPGEPRYGNWRNDGE